MINRKRILFGAIPFLIVLLAGCQILSLNGTEQPAPQIQSTSSALLPTSNLDLVESQDRLVSIYQEVNPGVVAIQILTDQGGALGSGFVYDKAGYIITNAHVVEGATSVEVDFPSGVKTAATIIGEDLDSDIAVLKVDINADELHPLVLGDSNQVQVGQYAIAIGNPFGLYSSMTTGVISAKGRQMESLHQTPGGNYFTAGDLIQTDAAINVGNSGGPLLNLDGQVIGINRAIQTSSNTTVGGEPGNIGIGFAIPINIVKRVVPVLIAEGHYDYPYVGVTSLDTLSLAEMEALGLTKFSGLYVIAVASGSPADKAGIQAGTTETQYPDLLAGGDIIVALDGITIHSFNEFLGYLFENKGPGDNVVFTVLRDNTSVEVSVTLASRPK
jgi:S1-C subfamily serine protease